MDCLNDELRRREAERGDRAIGQGESQIDDLEPQNLYDMITTILFRPILKATDLTKGKKETAQATLSVRTVAMK